MTFNNAWGHLGRLLHGNRQASRAARLNIKALKRILIIVALCGLVAKATPAPSERKEKPVAFSFNWLKTWTYVEAQHTPIPKFIQQYDGKPVEMIGYMIPLSETRQIKSFVLVPSLFGCCYGQPPAVNHVVLVRMTGGATTKVYDDKIRVRGQFHCGEEKEDGYLISLYHIDADEVVAE